jgi:hypothetical protein
MPGEADQCLLSCLCLHTFLADDSLIPPGETTPLLFSPKNFAQKGRCYVFPFQAKFFGPMLRVTAVPNIYVCTSVHLRDFKMVFCSFFTTF